MIKTFFDKTTEAVWHGEMSRRLPPDIQRPALRKLRQINRIVKPHGLLIPPGNRFEELKGERKGTYSIRINDQWRITFRWEDGSAIDVRIEDYHR